MTEGGSVSLSFGIRPLIGGIPGFCGIRDGICCCPPDCPICPALNTPGAHVNKATPATAISKVLIRTSIPAHT